MVEKKQYEMLVQGVEAKHEEYSEGFAHGLHGKLKYRNEKHFMLGHRMERCIRGEL